MTDMTDMSEFVRRYEKRFGSWYFMDGERPTMMADAVAIAFKRDDLTLLWHGDPKTVNQRAANDTRRLMESGLNEWAQNITVITSPNWNEAELNRLVDNSSYLPAFLRAHGIDPANPLRGLPGPGTPPGR